MNVYIVKISDRQRKRTVSANDAAEAIRKAVGARLYSSRQESRCENRHGQITSTRYQLNIQTGPTRHNATPVVERWATVFPCGQINA